VDDIPVPVDGLAVLGPERKLNPETAPIFFAFGSSQGELTPTSINDGVRIEKCVDITEDQANEIADDPWLFYVAVRSSGGEKLRDQLGKTCRKNTLR